MFTEAVVAYESPYVSISNEEIMNIKTSFYILNYLKNTNSLHLITSFSIDI